MKEEQMDNLIRIRIIELEDKLMDLIELSSEYENIPIPIFEFEMIKILKEIEHLESLVP